VGTCCETVVTMSIVLCLMNQKVMTVIFTSLRTTNPTVFNFYAFTCTKYIYKSLLSRNFTDSVTHFKTEVYLHNKNKRRAFLGVSYILQQCVPYFRMLYCFKAQV